MCIYIRENVTQVFIESAKNPTKDMKARHEGEKDGKGGRVTEAVQQ